MGGSWHHVKEENAPFRKCGEQLAGCSSGLRPGAPLGSWPGRAGAAHTCTPWPCSWSTRALRALIPLRRASRCSTEEIPRLIRSLQRRAGQIQLALPHLLLTLPLSGQGRAQNQDGLGFPLGRGRVPGLLRLTGQSWRPRPPGSRSQLRRSCPCSGPGPGPPATHPRSRRRGRWRGRGPPAGWEA